MWAIAKPWDLNAPTEQGTYEVIGTFKVTYDALSSHVPQRFADTSRG